MEDRDHLRNVMSNDSGEVQPYGQDANIYVYHRNTSFVKRNISWQKEIFPLPNIDEKCRLHAVITL